MKTKDFWTISLILLGMNLILSLLFTGGYFIAFAIIMGASLAVISFPLVASVVIITPLFYLKKKIGFYLAAAYSGFFTIFPAGMLILLWFLKDSPETTAKDFITGLMMLLAISLILNAPLLFSVWKSKDMFEKK